jgi:hypothetical protein
MLATPHPLFHPAAAHDAPLLSTPMSHGALAVVEAWHAAVNDGSPGRVEALSAAQVQVLGPRGSGTVASEDLGAWMTRSGFSAVPKRWFCGADGTVVVEQAARWEDPTTGSVTGQSTLATHFKVERQLVVTARRHVDLMAALDDGGLSLADEVTRRRSAASAGAR